MPKVNLKLPPVDPIELEKVRNSFTYFCSSIKLPQRNWTLPPDTIPKLAITTRPLILAKHQLEFVKYLESGLNEKIVLKSRQKGFSTCLIAHCLWQVLYTQNTKILYNIKKEDDANGFLMIARQILDSIPLNIKPQVYVNKRGLIINKGLNSTLMFKTVADGDGARSHTYTSIIGDEFDFYKPSTAENFLSASSAATSNRIIISTPNVEGGYFHKLVKRAEENGTLFKHLHYDNYEEFFGSMENAKLWYEKHSKGCLTEAQKIRELDCEFKGAMEDQVWTIEPYMFQSCQPPVDQRIIVSLDLGFEDPTAILYAWELNKKLYVFAEDQYHKFSIPEIVKKVQLRGYGIKYIVMDAAGKRVDQTSGLSCYNMVKQNLARPILSKKIPDQVEMVRIANTALLEGIVKVDQVNCKLLDRALNNMSWKNGKIPKSEYKHISDAFVYLVYNWRANQVASKQTNYVSIPSFVYRSV